MMDKQKIIKEVYNDNIKTLITSITAILGSLILLAYQNIIIIGIILLICSYTGLTAYKKTQYLKNKYYTNQEDKNNEWTKDN